MAKRIFNFEFGDLDGFLNFFELDKSEKEFIQKKFIKSLVDINNDKQREKSKKNETNDKTEKNICFDFYEEPKYIYKKNGELRKILEPKKCLKNIQKKISNKLINERLKILNDRKVRISYGFEKESNIMENAYNHVGKRYILNTDISNFFESFNFGRVYSFFCKNELFRLHDDEYKVKVINDGEKYINLASLLANIVTVNNELPQGAPTSPVIANILMDMVDYQILELARKYSLYYTRYADDLTFSTNANSFSKQYNKFVRELMYLLGKNGFKLNLQKTRFYDDNCRKEVTGLTVNEKVNISSDYYRKCRSMVNSFIRKGYFYTLDSSGRKVKETDVDKLISRLMYIHNVVSFNENKNKYKSKLRRDYTYLLKKILVYKYFYKNSKITLLVEGKTDCFYFNAFYRHIFENENQNLSKRYSRNFVNNKYHFYKNVVILNGINKTMLSFIFDDAEEFGGPKVIKDIKKIYNSNYKKVFNIEYNESNKSNKSNKNISQYFYNMINEKCYKYPEKPVVLLLDNENDKQAPLNKAKEEFRLSKLEEKSLEKNFFIYLQSNLYLAVLPKTKGEKIEIENLFDIDYIKSKYFDGKEFNDDHGADRKNTFNKNDMSKVVYDNRDDEKIGLGSLESILGIFLSIEKDYKKRTKNSYDKQRTSEKIVMNRRRFPGEPNVEFEIDGIKLLINDSKVENGKFTIYIDAEGEEDDISDTLREFSCLNILLYKKSKNSADKKSKNSADKFQSELVEKVYKDDNNRYIVEFEVDDIKDGEYKYKSNSAKYLFRNVKFDLKLH